MEFSTAESDPSNPSSDQMAAVWTGQSSLEVGLCPYFSEFLVFLLLLHNLKISVYLSMCCHLESHHGYMAEQNLERLSISEL